MPGLLCRMVSELHCLQLRRGPVTLPGGETRFGQCFGFCEEWYDACQECEEEETCQPCQPQEEPEEGCAGGNCPIN